MEIYIKFDHGIGWEVGLGRSISASRWFTKNCVTWLCKKNSVSHRFKKLKIAYFLICLRHRAVRRGN
jgi:hypothetical protein